METGSDENATRVGAVYAALLDSMDAGKPLSAPAELVYQVESLLQEVNSGASFEQYFRWLRLTDERRILRYLDDLELPQASAIVERAIAAAFPDGIPRDDDDYDACTDWSDSQAQELAALFVEFEQYNGAITNRLGEFIRQQEPETFAPRDRYANGGVEAAQWSDPQAMLAQLVQLRDPAGLGEARRNAWMARSYEASMRNGGHWRLFMDSDDCDQSPVIAALREVGAEQQVDLLAQAVSRMPPGYR